MTNITGVDALSDNLGKLGFNKTTHIGKNEANFTGYIGALNDNLKEQMVFSTKEQYEIRNAIAEKFKNKNNYKSSEFMKLCKDMGFEVNCKYEKTSYIVDNKKGNFTTNKTNGSIAVYTIKDPKTGAEIKIVDANGNGAIEVEELFANEVLQGISNDLSAMQSSAAGNGGARGVQMGTLDGYGQDNGSNNKRVEMGEYMQHREALQEQIQKMYLKEEAIKEKYGEFEAKLNMSPEELEELAKMEEEKVAIEAQVEKDELDDKENYEQQGYEIISTTELKARAMDLVKGKLAELKEGSPEYLNAIDDILSDLYREGKYEVLLNGDIAWR